MERETNYLTVNGGCPACLYSSQFRVNGYRFRYTKQYYWEVGGNQYFHSDTPELARTKMQSAIEDGVTF